MTMKKMDEDKDGKVSFADFEVDFLIVVFVGKLIVIFNNKNPNKNKSIRQKQQQNYQFIVFYLRQTLTNR